MPCKKGKQSTTKAMVAATKKSDKQDDRARKREFKKQQAIAKDYQSKEERDFASFLAEIGLIIKYMDGDGNCLFRSLADQLTGKQDNHLVFRFKVMSYIEEQRDHFILFMEDDEDFDDYVSRMKTTREWGGHQELYAASQSFRVNIVVHQADYSQAPRFVLQCEEATRDIHLSYHGDCHYNSVRSVQDVDGDDGSCRPAMEISLASLSCSPSAAVSSTSSSSSMWTKQEQAVMRGLPWITDIAEAQLALHRCSNDADAAIELLMMHPNGLLSTTNDADHDNDDTAVLAEEVVKENGEESQSKGIVASGDVTETIEAAVTSSSSSSTTVVAPSISAPSSSSIREATHSSLSKKGIRQQVKAATAAAKSKPSSTKSAKASTSKVSTKVGTRERSRDDHDVHDLTNGVRQIYL